MQGRGRMVLISLNGTWNSWEKARNAFHQKLENIPVHVNKSSHDAFAGHLLMVHRLKCSECKGEDVPILPALNHAAQRAVNMVKESQTQTVTEPAELEFWNWRVSHKTLDAETQTLPDNENWSTAASSETDPAPGLGLGTATDEDIDKRVAVTVQEELAVSEESHSEKGCAESEDKAVQCDCDERQSSTPFVSSGSTVQRNVGSRIVPQQPVLHRDENGRFVSVKDSRRETSREAYSKRKRQEEQDIVDAPCEKKGKISLPNEKQPIPEPRKSERIKQRIETQANSLQECVATPFVSSGSTVHWNVGSRLVPQQQQVLHRDEYGRFMSVKDSRSSMPASKPPATTLRADEDDGWIADDPISKHFEKLRKGGSSSESMSNIGACNKRDADGLSLPVSKSMSTSNCIQPKASIVLLRSMSKVIRCVDSPSSANSESLSDYLEPSNSRDADNPAGLQFGLSRWSKKLSPVSIPEFHGPPPGPTTKLSAQHQEITFFHLLFPAQLIEHLVVNSNYFAERLLITAPSVVRWTPLTVDEMKAFLALQLLMSINKNPDLSSYWSEECSFGGVNVSEVMSEDRFQALLVYFQPCTCYLQSGKRGECHGIDSKGCKILDIINACCRLQYSPHRDCSVHETMMRQGNKEKIHVCLRVDSANGYCSEFQVCPSLKGHGQSRNGIVIDLTHRLQKKNYIVNLSESFANLELLKRLEAKGILCRGAINRSQKLRSLPSELFSKSVRQNVTFQQGNITACSWYNKVRRRRVISSADDPKGAYEIVQTHKGKSRISRCPKAVVHHMKSLYAKPFNNPCPTQGRSLRRNQCIFWFAFDVVIANAFILKHGSGCTLEGMKSFRKSLALQLIKSNSQQGDFQPSVVTSGGDAQPCSSYPDSGICNAQPAKPSDSMGMHSHRVVDNIQPAGLSDGLNVQYAQQSESTINDAQLGGPTDDIGMQVTQAIYSDNADVNIQISRVIGGFSMPSDTLHSDETDEHVEPPRSNDGFDMHSHSKSSDSSDVNSQISRVTGGIGMQSQTLHPSSTSDNFSSVRLTEMQSQALHSESTSEDVKPVLSNDGINMHSHSLHSGSASGGVQPLRLTEGLDMQSKALPSDNTGEDVKPLLSNDGINMLSPSLHSDDTSDNALSVRFSDDLDIQSQTLHLVNTNNLHSAVPIDGTGLQSPSCSSQVQHTKIVHSHYDIAKKIKVEPSD